MKENHFECTFTPYVPEKVDTFLKEEFQSYSLKKVGTIGDINPYCFVLRDDQIIVGAIAGKTFYGGLHIKELVVNPQYRTKGLGTKLMEKAFNYGKEKGCKFTYLETFCFQARGFYEKLGFFVDFARKGYEANGKELTFYYMSKKLS